MNAEPLTPDEARAKVDKIRAVWFDDERAHVLEDELRAEVLGAVVAGSPDAAELARIALSTSEIDFARWCA